MQNKIDSDQIAQKLSTQGEKIKYLRRLCGLSRRDFFDKYQISESTLRSWELDISPISDRLMKKFLDALSHEGLSISPSWIRTEAHVEAPVKNDPSPLNLREKTAEDEARFFLSSGANRVVKQVRTSCNLPYFREGDLVGGEICSADRSDLILENFCLGQLHSSQEWSLYLVKPSEKQGCFTLLHAKSFENPSGCRVLYDATIEKIAPVIWYRRLTL